MSKHRAENAASLAATLARKVENMQEKPERSLVGDVAELQRIARALHKMDERACNEDLGCRTCDGYGTTDKSHNVGPKCPKCDGHGTTTGKREERLTEKARAIAAAYGFRLYVQGDPRGWPLYLIPDTYPATEDGSWYSSRGLAVCPQ